MPWTKRRLPPSLLTLLNTQGQGGKRTKVGDFDHFRASQGHLTKEGRAESGGEFWNEETKGAACSGKDAL